MLKMCSKAVITTGYDDTSVWRNTIRLLHVVPNIMLQRWDQFMDAPQESGYGHLVALDGERKQFYAAIAILSLSCRSSVQTSVLAEGERRAPLEDSPPCNRVWCSYYRRNQAAWALPRRCNLPGMHDRHCSGVW